MEKNTDGTNKTFSVYNNTEQRDVFRIYGDGKVYATEINVKLSSDFPDYVFEGDYELKTLNELKDYLKENGRLPNMPSANDVKKNGLNLGETNRLLVEKVEELTLYLIQLNDKLIEQEKEIMELKNH